MPVAAGAGQPGHLDPEHQADAAEPDLGDQPLEPRPGLGRTAGSAEIVVDDHDPLGDPAELLGAFGQGVLEPGRFRMAADLLQGRLAEVDDGEPVTVAAFDLVRRPGSQGSWPGLPGASGRSPSWRRAICLISTAIRRRRMTGSRRHTRAGLGAFCMVISVKPMCEGQQVPGTNAWL